jgi:hypothetical protein
MHKRQSYRLQALRAAQAFLADNAQRFPTVANSGARMKLDKLMADIKRHVTNQSGNELTAQIKTKKIKALRRALVRDHMTHIARIAAAELPDHPDLSPLRLPKKAPSLERLIAHARGMAAMAKTHAPVFVAAGQPSDFLARLDAAAKALGDAAVERVNVRGARGGATKGLEQQLRSARKQLRVLDSYVATALQDDGALLAGWKTVKRVYRGTRPTHAVSVTPLDVPYEYPIANPLPASNK